MATDSVVTPPEGYNIVDTSNLPAGYAIVPPPSTVDSAITGAANNVPLLKQAVAALSKGSYSDNMQELNNEAAQAKATNPKSYGAGAVTGALAPLAIPGVGEALEASPVAGNAALGLANGVNDVDVMKHPGEATKQGIIGAGIGGAVGKAGEALLGNAPESLENLANRKTVESAQLPAGLLNRPKEEIESLGRTMHEMGLDTGSIDQKVNIAATHLKDVGGKIGALGQGLPPLQDATPFVQQLHNKIGESADIFGAGANPEAPLYRAGIDKLSQPGLTFEQLQKMKTAIGQRAFDSTGEVKNDAAANLYGVYKDALKSMVKSAPEEYQSLMDKYGDLIDINDALGKLRGRLNAGALPGKPMGMMGKMGSMITGGNIPATLGASAALAPVHPYGAAMLGASLAGNPEAVGTLARGAANALPTAKQGMSQELIDYLTSKFGGSNENK